MSASFEGLCPSCGKRFNNDSLVLRHMNHPRTSCASWHTFLESTSLGQLNHPTNEHTTPNFGTNDNDTTDNDEPASNSPTLTTARYEDIHPNISLVLGTGPGFMDRLNTGPHAEKRGVNLYHPFSSKEEWGLASWLLLSGLSMRAIDDFLALPIVSSGINAVYSLLIEN
jgi:hypothetical protein